VAYCEIPCEEGWTKGPFGITYQPNEKAKVIADSLENQFTSHDLSDENHARHVEITVQALLASVSGTPLGKLRPCDIHISANSLKLRKACGFDGIPEKCLRHLPIRPLIYLTHLFNHCLWLPHFPKHWKEAKFMTLPKPGKNQNFHKIYIRLASCLQQASYSRKSF
jgi:hypothetical protein